jgi:hypothetical protein
MLKSSSLCLYSSNLGTFWLKIEQFWPFEDISIFSNGGHLGYRTAYKHNDELFNIYYGIFNELWNFADFDRLCKLEKRGMKLKKNLLLWNYWANLNQTLLICLFSNLHNRSKSEISKFIKNLVIYVKKLIIMLMPFKFGHFLLKFCRFWPIMQIRKKRDEI